MATPTTSGWATQVPSKPAPASRSLSARTASMARSVRLRVRAGRDERGHAAHGERAAAVAGRDQQLGVGPHERHRHLHLGPVGQHELRPVPERLDHREDVVPAARVQPVRVVAQLVEDLLHLERGRQGLDQHGGPDRPLSECRAPPGRTRTRRSRAGPPGGAPAWAGRGTAPRRGRSAFVRCGTTYSPKSRATPEIGSPSTSRCCSCRCQPRGRTSSVAGSSTSA